METVKIGSREITFTKNNPENIKRALDSFKNVLICGIKGVGKITNTITAVKGNTNVFYIGNPVDFEGKRRPGSYEKYLRYIAGLKSDITIVVDINELFKMEDEIVLIVDEIYGRSDEQLDRISRIFDTPNIRVVQIVGCMKNMKGLIEKIDIVVELHPDGAYVIDKELAKSICRIYG